MTPNPCPKRELFPSPALRALGAALLGALALSACSNLPEGSAASASSGGHMFRIAGGVTVDLDALARELRAKIPLLPEGEPRLEKANLGEQAGVTEYLVVVAGHENPHVHPGSDLIVSVLEGHGFFELADNTRVQAPLGSVVVIPQGVCHAFHNQSPGGTVLFATFSMPNPASTDCPPQ